VVEVVVGIRHEEGRAEGVGNASKKAVRLEERDLGSCSGD